MSVVLTTGQAGDNPQLMPLLEQIEGARWWAPSIASEAVGGGQGLFASEYPRPSAWVRDPVHLSGVVGSDGHAGGEGITGWASTVVRPVRMRGSQRRRALHQPTRPLP